MTYQYQDSNYLCDKLRYKFKDRGIHNIFNAAPTASFSGEKRQNTTNTASFGDRERMVNPFGTAENTANNTYTNSVNNGSRSRCGARSYEAVYARGAKIRNYAGRFNASAYEKRRGACKASRPVKVKKSFGEAIKCRLSSFFSRDNDGTENEKKIKSAPVPKGFVAALVLCTVLLLVVLATYSSYSQISSEVKQLQDEQTALLQERDKVSNLLSIRDDIREIELYATEEIGMVKSDYVETRHVSVAGGERVEVIEVDEEEAPEGIFSTLLSAMGGYREKLLEYID